VRIVARRLDRSEIDHELVWLGASLASLALAAAWFAVGLPWPRCMFHELTGLPCVTCGMTRCGIEFFHGHFFAALKWNPLVFALLCGVIAFDLYALVALAPRRPRLRILFRQAEKKYARGVIVAVLALNWFYLLSHWRDF
jgi:hypothetical protein